MTTLDIITSAAGSWLIGSKLWQAPFADTVLFTVIHKSHSNYIAEPGSHVLVPRSEVRWLDEEYLDAAFRQESVIALVDERAFTAKLAQQGTGGTHGEA